MGPQGTLYPLQLGGVFPAVEITSDVSHTLAKWKLLFHVSVAYSYHPKNTYSSNKVTSISSGHYMRNYIIIIYNMQKKTCVARYPHATTITELH